MVALLGGALILIFGRIKPSKVIQRVDWVLLLFFASLFIVVHGIEKEGVMETLVNRVSLKENVAGLGGVHLVSLVLSQIISNVPYTVVMLPLMKSASILTMALSFLIFYLYLIL
jgi:Na+/H+ antiporter NhaD/arsenite permease-like protein